MDINIINKIYPIQQNLNYSTLEYDQEGLYSITLPEDANKISDIIINEVGNNSIFDGTAGLGGNTISFCKKFKIVIAVEMNIDRFNILKKNIDTYNLKNIKLINDNCINHLIYNCNAFFFDPPWGGPEYKNNKNIRLKLGDYELIDIIKKIKKKFNKLVFLKLPNNYDIYEFKDFKIKINKIKNYQLITI